ncbi:sigma factor [[Clostridium] polysaccharolyticum]|uniref:Sigma-70 region 3 n=1 Tax=[Clostridium] polysaccharolyticum TaxID=29364 RepID=A0A1I0FEW9_9FIRM|nr:sigma factor [[Clostridium] polysaccharolyticum]SET56627.1 Sigma-70 region 3 [[Clostridium] polysaccharolyticum]
MIEQGKFLEMLKEIMEVAKVQENRISKDKLAKLLGDVELSEQQFEAVYAYLAENKIEVEGFVYVPPRKEIEVPEEEKATEEDSVFLKMYKEELQEVEHLSKEEKELFLQELSKGEDRNQKRLINGFLHDVITIVQKYKNKGVRVEDLIQEGNMAAVMAIDRLLESGEAVDEAYMLTVIEDAIVTAIDEETSQESEEDTIVAKANLIREAAKHLEEDMGRAPSVKELEDYTKISEEEIRDILNLSKEK